ncbi:MAG: thioredoxin domain-containing protein [Pyrinomonadaceae bacterium]
MMSNFLAKAAMCVVFAFLLNTICLAQAAKPAAKKPADVGPKVTQVDIEGLKALLKTNNKPLLINFWATWCEPCREEFPDLVKIDAVYRGKIDFITISLDDVEDIIYLVPKFLREVKAEMPAYLLKTPDESAAIALVAKEWSGNLPMTILFDAAGEKVYQKNGKISFDSLGVEIAKVLTGKAVGAP